MHMLLIFCWWESKLENILALSSKTKCAYILYDPICIRPREILFICARKRVEECICQHCLLQWKQGNNLCPGLVAQLLGALSHTPKGCEFDPQLGSVGGQPIDVSLSHLCFSGFSLPSSLSLKSINVSSGED